MEGEINDKPSDLCDSITIGSATKGGALKIYGNFSNMAEFKKKIDNAAEVQKYANANISINI